VPPEDRAPVVGHITALGYHRNHAAAALKRTHVERAQVSGYPAEEHLWPPPAWFAEIRGKGTGVCCRSGGLATQGKLMTFIVHGGSFSPFVRKVCIALAEKSLDFEMKAMNPFPRTPELLALSPLGKMPVLEDSDQNFTIPDSSVICAYLERLRPEPRLYPDDPKELARALWLEEYADTKLLEVTGAIGFERIIKPNVFQLEPDDAVVRNAMENLVPPAFDYLEGELDEGANSFLSSISIADLATGCQLQALTLGGEAIDPARWPLLAGYSDRLLARPSFENAAR
jgi:glutathione S-transferase